jgi:hypothetical protein
MSLKNLLAVGESFFGVSTEPSPYEVRKNAQLPVFGVDPRVEKEKESQNLSHLAGSIPANIGEEKAPQVELDFEKRVKISPERSRLEKEPEERRTFLGRRPKTSRPPAQEEMSLDEVRVVRNDLSDSDLEFAPRKAARTEQLALNPFAPRPIAAIGRPTHEKQSWAARVARLFGFLRPGRP